MIQHLDSDQGLNAGNTYTNASAEGGIRLDLPAATEELGIVVAVHAPHRILLVADSADQIFLGVDGGSAAQADAVGSHLALTCTKSGRWTALYSGGWTVVTA